MCVFFVFDVFFGSLVPLPQGKSRYEMTFGIQEGEKNSPIDLVNFDLLGFSKPGFGMDCF